MDFAVSTDHRVKLKESEKDRQVLGSCQRTKKNVEHEDIGDTNCNWRASNGFQRLEELEISRKSRDQSNLQHCEIDQNTEKSPGELRRLDVTHTPVKDHQLMLVWRTHNNNNNNNNKQRRKNQLYQSENRYDATK